MNTIFLLSSPVVGFWLGRLFSLSKSRPIWLWICATVGLTYTFLVYKCVIDVIHLLHHHSAKQGSDNVGLLILLNLTAVGVVTMVYFENVGEKYQEMLQRERENQPPGQG